MLLLIFAAVNHVAEAVVAVAVDAASCVVCSVNVVAGGRYFHN